MIYLDNAATTYPKPKCVIDAVIEAQELYAGNPGRASHSLSSAASDVIFSLRCNLCDFFALSKPENVVLTFNATYALNIAVNALWRGGHILMSDLEHNSVLRPIALRTANYSLFNAYSDDIIAEIDKKRHYNTKMLICTHKSNTLGKILPISDIGKYCKRHNIVFIIDASQSAGINRIGFDDVFADAICIPSHKGLYGMQGMGAVLFSEKYGKAGVLRPLIAGGSGVMSKSPKMPYFLPERLEAGTLSVPIAASWSAGIKYVSEMGIDGICRAEGRLSRMCIEALGKNKNIEIYNRISEYDSGIVLFSISGLQSDAVGYALNKSEICVRSGFHCAPLSLNKVYAPPDGAVRVSFGIFNTESDVRMLIGAINNIT